MFYVNISQICRNIELSKENTRLVFCVNTKRYITDAVIQFVPSPAYVKLFRIHLRWFHLQYFGRDWFNGALNMSELMRCSSVWLGIHMICERWYMSWQSNYMQTRYMSRWTERKNWHDGSAPWTIPVVQMPIFRCGPLLQFKCAY